jgi:molybdate transport system substrate-binding protein
MNSQSHKLLPFPCGKGPGVRSIQPQWLVANALCLAALLLTFLCSAPRPACAADLTIAAASDLTYALKDLAAQYEKQTGDSVRISYGSSGNFFSQIKNGAPFDLFFSADVVYPRQLEAAGLTEPGTLYEYARGTLVLWVPNASKLDLNRGIEVLKDQSIKKIAIANPEHAPYGAAAVAAMRHARIYDELKSKLVMGENIAQTAQFVSTGNADVGMLALSLALAPPMKSAGRYIEVPASDYPPIIQAAVIVNSSPNKPAAKRFMAFIKQPSTAELLARYGFTASR